jgi:DNA-binding CsgD family transcriptional regulator
MTIVPMPQESRSEERIRAICRSAPDAMTLRSEILRELGRQFDFDAHVWLLTDPVTSVGCSPLADVPVDDLPALIRLKYLTDVNRWTRMAAGKKRAGSLVEATGGNLEASLIWRDMLREYDIVDMASVVFADNHFCWGFLDLWRSAPGVPFDTKGIAFLSELAVPITAALRRCQAATFGAPAPQVSSAKGPVILLLDEGLRVTSQTTAAHDWLDLLVPPQPGRAPVPAGAYNVAAQLVASEQGVDRNQPLARVHLANSLWVTMRATRLSGAEASGASAPGAIAVTIEETSPPDRLEVFSLAFGLSPRQRELVSLMAAGADTKEMATRLFLSQHTVQDHLKTIFDKTSTHSRRTLLSRVLGTQPGPDAAVGS